MSHQARLSRILGQIKIDEINTNNYYTAPTATDENKDNKEKKEKDDKKKQEVKQTLTIIDNRAGKKYEIPIKHNSIQAEALNKIRTKPKKSGLKSYDAGYMNTASCTSRITFINGGKGILRYRGYPIEQLAEKSTFLEVSYLLLYGQLPDKEQIKYFTNRVMKHTYVHEDLKTMMSSFRYDAHPMGMLISTITAMSTFHPEANPALVGQNVYNDDKVRNKQIHRILGTMPTIAAYAYRHRIGRPYVNPSAKGLTYTENFLYMLDKIYSTCFCFRFEIY